MHHEEIPLVMPENRTEYLGRWRELTAKGKLWKDLTQAVKNQASQQVWHQVDAELAKWKRFAQAADNNELLDGTLKHEWKIARRLVNIAKMVAIHQAEELDRALFPDLSSWEWDVFCVLRGDCREALASTRQNLSVLFEQPKHIGALAVLNVEFVVDYGRGEIYPDPQHNGFIEFKQTFQDAYQAAWVWAQEDAATGAADIEKLGCIDARFRLTHVPIPNYYNSALSRVVGNSAQVAFYLCLLQAAKAYLSHNYSRDSDSLDPWVAVTATLDESRCLGPVSGLEAKLEAAYKKGLSTVIVAKEIEDAAREALNKAQLKTSNESDTYSADTKVFGCTTPEVAIKEASRRADEWMLPTPNPFFTGRKEILQKLHDTLTQNYTVALTQKMAITGLGGIGKTQTAIEYAYRHRGDYRYVLWVNAADGTSATDSFFQIARRLKLPTDRAPDMVIGAVKRWLNETPNWLLIFDNADDLIMAREFLPSDPKGHILLTTRASATGDIAQAIELEKMPLEDGALFLLRRAKIVEIDGKLSDAGAEDQRLALEITEEMDGLPLALDQAGAFIEEKNSSLARYLDLYKAYGTELRKRRGRLGTDHPESVTITFLMGLKQVLDENLAAADIMRVCAFLAPDAIPEEIFREGGIEIGGNLASIATNELDLEDAFGVACRFSLLRREPNTETLWMHRLVQEVLKDEMTDEVRRHWAECVVRAIHHVFPPPVEASTMKRCESLISHAQACAKLSRKWEFEFAEAGKLLYFTAWYLEKRADYGEVEPLLQQALKVLQTALGPDSPEVAEILVRLGGICRFYFSKRTEAEKLYRQALAIYEKKQDQLGMAKPIFNTT